MSMTEEEPPDLNPPDATTSHPTTPPRYDHSPPPSRSTPPPPPPPGKPSPPPPGKPSPPPSPKGDPCPNSSGQTSASTRLANNVSASPSSGPSSNVRMKPLRWALSNILVMLISEKILWLYTGQIFKCWVVYTLEFSRSKGRLKLQAPVLSAFK